MSVAQADPPTVSVITPIYKRADLIPALLTTLRNQTFADWELILVDDCSPDVDMAAEVEAARADLPNGEPRLRFLARSTNGGPGSARNTGLEAARGRYVAFLDSDDTWTPDKLARQVAAAEDTPDPSHVFCVTQTRVLYGGGAEAVLPERAVAAGESWGQFLYVHNNFAQCSSFFLGRALADKVRFDERLRQYEDHLYFITAGAASGQYILIEAPLVIWHNDDRADRMGARDDLTKGDLFLDIATQTGVMDKSEQLAFRVRCLGPVLAAQNRWRALGLAAQALIAGGLPKEAGIKLLLNAVMGPAAYARLRAARR